MTYQRREEEGGDAGWNLNVGSCGCKVPSCERHCTKEGGDGQVGVRVSERWRRLTTGRFLLQRQERLHSNRKPPFERALSLLGVPLLDVNLLHPRGCERAQSPDSKQAVRHAVRVLSPPPTVRVLDLENESVLAFALALLGRRVDKRHESHHSVGQATGPDALDLPFW